MAITPPVNFKIIKRLSEAEQPEHIIFYAVTENLWKKRRSETQEFYPNVTYAAPKVKVPAGYEFVEDLTLKVEKDWLYLHISSRGEWAPTNRWNMTQNGQGSFYYIRPIKKDEVMSKMPELNEYHFVTLSDIPETLFKVIRWTNNRLYLLNTKVARGSITDLTDNIIRTRISRVYVMNQLYTFASFDPKDHTLIWEKQPEISIDVRVNGKSVKLSDISEETLLKIRSAEK